MPRRDIQFELLGVDPTGARRSRFTTTHGTVECPAFMAVGTQGTVKAVSPHQVKDTGTQVVLANTFHMSLEDRRDRVRQVGGLHTFMAWDRTILTDSGGFQVFSIPDKKIEEAGVTFTYGKSGDIHMTPESSMEIQRDLGADIIMAFDECIEYPTTREYVERSADRTLRWAKRCFTVPLQPHQHLFGIIQGGTWHDLRKKCVDQITSLPFDGFAIGGVSVGEGHELLKDIVGATAPHMPTNLPRYLMGVGTPEDILESVERGIDMFDCVIPTRYARGGTLFTRTGRLRIGDKKYRKDKFPLDTGCSCYTCTNFSRLVLRHLHYAQEPLYATLASIHNLHFYQDLMRDIRTAIERKQFARFKTEFLAKYRHDDGGDDDRPKQKVKR